MVAHGRVTVTEARAGRVGVGRRGQTWRILRKRRGLEINAGLQNAISPPTETRSGDQRPVQPCPVSSL